MAAALTVVLRERPILFSGPMVKAILEGRKTQTRRVVLYKKVAPPPWTKHVNELTQPLYSDPSKWVSSHLWQWSELEQTPARKLRRWPVASVKLEAGRREDWEVAIPCPYGVPGNLLWVRETFSELSAVRHTDRRKDIIYRADIPAQEPPFKIVDGAKVLTAERIAWIAGQGVEKWKPSIHMPRWASRITLEITDVRVQRVQEITPEDAKSEGVERNQNGLFKDYTTGGFSLHFPHLSFGSLWDSINAKRGYGWDANPWVWVVSFKRVAA